MEGEAQACGQAETKEGKVNRMDKTIWEYFGVEPIDPAKARVFGVDFGAGELAATYVDPRESLDRMLVNMAGENESISGYVYTVYNNKRNRIGQEALKYSDDDILYTNIKTTPENARKIYGSGRGIQLEGEGVFTYQFLQETLFHHFIKNILRYNGRVCSGSGEVYLFVGRPASDVWEKQAKDYQNILKNGVSGIEAVKLVDGSEAKVKCHIIVYSEAEAAMAYEYKKGNIGSNEAVLIIDGGSSTFDSVLVKNGKVVNEYSRQVGAGMIEQNLFDIFLLGKEVVGLAVGQRKMEHDKKMKMQPFDSSEGYLTLTLRLRKEGFYGSDGTNGRKDDRITALQNGVRKSLDIDSEVMDIAVNQMPVRVERSYQDEIDPMGGNLTQDYKSFHEAIEVFFQGAKARCIEKETGKPVKVDRIVFTGGATIMPFVQELAKNVFEVEKNGIAMESPSEDRHFSVARGLAYMGYVELTKCHELKKLKEAVRQKMEGIRQSISKSVRDTCANMIWQECYINQIAQWTNDVSAKTFNDWLKMPYHIPIDAVRENLGKLMQEKKVVKSINDIVVFTPLCVFIKSSQNTGELP